MARNGEGRNQKGCEGGMQPFSTIFLMLNVYELWARLTKFKVFESRAL